jgi:hypothetical protein
MAWTERFTCDVCGKLRRETEDWWLAINECAVSHAGGSSHPVLKLMPWDDLLVHRADSKHLCGGACAHTLLDRWMLSFHEGTEGCETE